CARYHPAWLSGQVADLTWQPELHLSVSLLRVYIWLRHIHPKAAMIRQPDPKPEILARRAEIVAGLRALLPETGVIAEDIRLKPYETDGLAAYRQPPLAVALPETTEQVAAVLRLCHENGVRIVPRGAGT